MDEGETFFENKTKGKKRKIVCQKCQIPTWHVVLTSIENYDCDVDENDHLVYERSATYEIIKCLGCEECSFRSDYTDTSLEWFDQEDGETQQSHIIEIFPHRVAGRKILEGNYSLPTMVRNIYLETHKAICSAQPILAGIGIRALVESVCKDRNAQGGNLKEKIDDLVTKGFLSMQGSDILHQVRTLGNEAAHEQKPHNENTLGLAMDVVEHLLTGVYRFNTMTLKDGDLPF